MTQSLKEIIETKVIPEITSVREPRKYFTSTLALRNPVGAIIRFGTRDVYTDFPRIAWIIYLELRQYCDNLASQQLSENEIAILLNWKPWQKDNTSIMIRNKLDDIVEFIKNEKLNAHPFNTIYQYTQYLAKLGISWSLDFRWWYQRPIIRLYLNRYYKYTWPQKILTFLKCLESGHDNPISIYKMASDMSVEYSLGNNGSSRSYIFNLFNKFGIGINIEVAKLKKLVIKLNAIFDKNEEITAYDILLQAEKDMILNDMYETLNEIGSLEYGGHFLSGYFALRHLLIDLGNLLLIDFLSQLSKRVLPPIYPIDSRQRIESMEYMFEESISKLNEYLDDFKSSWIQLLVIDNAGIPHLEVFRECNISETEHEEIKFTKLEHFMSRYKKKNLHQDIQNSRKVKLADSALVKLIDWVIYSRRKFSDVITDTQLLTRFSPKSIPPLSPTNEEYQKLNAAVHRPILVDFPPYGSTIEYLGFVHHLRIVRSIFERVLRVYRKKDKTKPHST